MRVGIALELDTNDEGGITTNYKERMDNATTHVTVSATVGDPGGATFVISPSDARPGAEQADMGHQVALRAGAETTITVRVTAEDPAKRQTYTVKVYRERATKSEDNNLTSLRLSAGTLTPVFNRDTTAYTAQVAANVTEVTVSYTASDTAGGSSVVVWHCCHCRMQHSYAHYWRRPADCGREYLHLRNRDAGKRPWHGRGL